jgi:hypothetical protein
MKQFQDLSDNVLLECAARTIEALAPRFSGVQYDPLDAEKQAYAAALDALRVACEEKTESP